MAKSAFLIIADLDRAERRGSIWPNFARRLPGPAPFCPLDLAKFCRAACPAKFGQIEPRISHGIRRAARFGQILPAGCPAKFGQIEPR